MLGQAIAMLVPQVVGFRLVGALPRAPPPPISCCGSRRCCAATESSANSSSSSAPGSPSSDWRPRDDREHGARVRRHLRHLPDRPRLHRLPPLHRTQRSAGGTGRGVLPRTGLFHGPGHSGAEYSDTLELDLATVEPSLAGPRRPQDRVPLSEVKDSFLGQLPQLSTRGGGLPVLDGNGRADDAPTADDAGDAGEPARITDGSVVIAAITSCTNTSNPSVMLAAGLLARKRSKPACGPAVGETSLAPGSKVVTDYLAEAV